MQDQSREYGQANFTLPHDVVPLPSKGVFYKNKKKSLKVGYLTAADENILLAGGKDVAMNLLRAKVYEPDMRVEDLMEGDIEAILIFLRNTAFGPDMNITVTDPTTKKQFQSIVRLDELGINEGQQPDEDGTFSLTLERSGHQVKLKPLTYGELREIDAMVESYPQGRVPPKATMTLAKQIVTLNGNPDKGEIAKTIEQLPLVDAKQIKRFMEENEPRLDMKKIVIAPSGEKVVVNVGFGVDFFRPFF